MVTLIRWIFKIALIILCIIFLVAISASLSAGQYGAAALCVGGLVVCAILAYEI